MERNLTANSHDPQHNKKINKYGSLFAYGPFELFQLEWRKDKKRWLFWLRGELDPDSPTSDRGYDTTNNSSSNDTIYRPKETTA